MDNCRSFDGLGKTLSGSFDLPLSKSMVNRGLLLAALWPEITLSGISSASDSQFLQNVLGAVDESEIFVGAGGTTLRFALAYWASREGEEIILKGTDYLNQRPISQLVDALNALGADISYASKEGCAPLAIRGKRLQGGSLVLGHVQSSQFVSALMLLGPSMEKGLQLSWVSLPSKPYVLMTAAILREAGFEVLLHTAGVSIAPGQKPLKKKLYMEPDWSAVAFWCEAVALSKEADIFFPGFQEDSLQGDSKVIHYFEPLGVKYVFENGGLRLQKKSVLSPGHVIYNLIGEPDLAQALVTTMLLKGIPFEINGLSTLVGKETDRIAWMKSFASTLGISLETTPSSVRCLKYPSQLVQPTSAFGAMGDHRVAMALAPVSLQFPIDICEVEVVKKSYPDFWEHWEKALGQKV